MRMLAFSSLIILNDFSSETSYVKFGLTGFLVFIKVNVGSLKNIRYLNVSFFSLFFSSMPLRSKVSIKIRIKILTASNCFRNCLLNNFELFREISKCFQILIDHVVRHKYKVVMITKLIFFRQRCNLAQNFSFLVAR